MRGGAENQPSQWWEWFDQERIIDNLEKIQNLIVIALSIGLFFIMVLRLGDLFLSLFVPLRFQNVT